MKERQKWNNHGLTDAQRALYKRFEEDGLSSEQASYVAPLLDFQIEAYFSAIAAGSSLEQASHLASLTDEQAFVFCRVLGLTIERKENDEADGAASAAATSIVGGVSYEEALLAAITLCTEETNDTNPLPIQDRLSYKRAIVYARIREKGESHELALQIAHDISEEGISGHVDILFPTIQVVEVSSEEALEAALVLWSKRASLYSDLIKQGFSDKAAQEVLSRVTLSDEQLSAISPINTGEELLVVMSLSNNSQTVVFSYYAVNVANISSAEIAIASSNEQELECFDSEEVIALEATGVTANTTVKKILASEETQAVEAASVASEEAEAAEAAAIAILVNQLSEDQHSIYMFLLSGDIFTESEALEVIDLLSDEEMLQFATAVEFFLASYENILELALSPSNEQLALAFAIIIQSMGICLDEAVAALNLLSPQQALVYKKERDNGMSHEDALRLAHSLSNEQALEHFKAEAAPEGVPEAEIAASEAEPEGPVADPSQLAVENPFFENDSHGAFMSGLV